MTPNDKIRLLILHTHASFERNPKVKMNGETMQKRIDYAATLIEEAEKHYDNLDELYGDREKIGRTKPMLRIGFRGNIW